MKRYLLFSWSYYLSGGGWHDFAGSYETLDEALEAISMYRRWHVVDVESEEIVAKGTTGKRMSAIKSPKAGSITEK